MHDGSLSEKKRESLYLEVKKKEHYTVLYCLLQLACAKLMAYMEHLVIYPVCCTTVHVDNT